MSTRQSKLYAQSWSSYKYLVFNVHNNNKWVYKKFTKQIHIENVEQLILSGNRYLKNYNNCKYNILSQVI